MRDDIGNDGAVAAAAYDKIDGRLASDLDCFLPGLKSTRTARCDVLRRIVRIEILDINIRGVRPGRRHAPSDMAVLAKDCQRHAGNRCAGGSKIWRNNTGEVPDTRRGEFKVGVVRENRHSRFCPCAGENLCVRCTVAF